MPWDVEFQGTDGDFGRQHRLYTAKYLPAPRNKPQLRRKMEAQSRKVM